MNTLVHCLVGANGLLEVSCHVQSEEAAQRTIDILSQSFIKSDIFYDYSNFMNLSFKINLNLQNMEKAPNRKKITSKNTLTVSGEGLGKEVFSVRFDLEDKYLACGCGDGSIDIFNVLTGKLTQHIVASSEEHKTAVMGLRWREHRVISETGTKTINYLLACYSDGSIHQYQIPPGKLVSTIKDPKNNLYCID